MIVDGVAADVASAGWGRGPHFPPKIASFHLHGWCPHDFPWLVLPLYLENSETMKLARYRHGVCLWV